jgi:hypothetical protein
MRSDVYKIILRDSENDKWRKQKLFLNLRRLKKEAVVKV